MEKIIFTTQVRQSPSIKSQTHTQSRVNSCKQYSRSGVCRASQALDTMTNKNRKYFHMIFITISHSLTVRVHHNTPSHDTHATALHTFKALWGNVKTRSQDSHNTSVAHIVLIGSSFYPKFTLEWILHIVSVGYKGGQQKATTAVRLRNLSNEWVFVPLWCGRNEKHSADHANTSQLQMKFDSLLFCCLIMANFKATVEFNWDKILLFLLDILGYEFMHRANKWNCIQTANLLSLVPSLDPS